MKYWQAKKLPSTKFKRMTGVKKKTFGVMVRLVKYKEKQKKKPGRRPKLKIEDQILLTLQYIARIPNLLSYRKRLGNFRIKCVSYCLKNRKYLNSRSENLVYQGRKNY